MKPIEPGCTVLILRSEGLLSAVARSEAKVVRKLERTEMLNHNNCVNFISGDYWELESPTINSICWGLGHPYCAFPEQWLMRLDGHEEKDDADTAHTEAYLSDMRMKSLTP